MPKLLRGKKLITINPKENFTKVPNSLFSVSGLSSTDKLILMKLHYYPNDWTLAYTRLAKDLSIDKSNVITRWKGLIEKGYIIETNENYVINYQLFEGSKNPPQEIGSKKQPTLKPTHDGRLNPPIDGSLNPPSKVALTLLNGRVNPPIEEETKEQDLFSKTKEEEQNQNPPKIVAQIKAGIPLTGNGNSNKTSTGQISDVGIETSINSSIEFPMLDINDTSIKKKTCIDASVNSSNVQISNSDHSFNSSTGEVKTKTLNKTSNEGVNSALDQSSKKKSNSTSMTYEERINEIKKRKPITSIEDLQRFWSRDVLLELQSLSFIQFIDKLEPYVDDYSTRLSLHSQLKKWDMDSSPKLNGETKSLKPQTEKKATITLTNESIDEIMTDQPVPSKKEKYDDLPV